MKIILLSLFAFAIIGHLNADVRELVTSQNELAHQNVIGSDNAALQNSYLPPVNSNIDNQYLPPSTTNVNTQYLPPETYEQDVDVTHNEESNVVHETEVTSKTVEPKPAHELKADGYHYKRPSRSTYRIRRDVESEQQYLPPDAPLEAIEVEDSEPAHLLTDDGYAYKTQKRVVYRRNRRDVAHLPENSYLSPFDEAASSSAINAETDATDSQIGLLHSSSDIIDNSNGYAYSVPQSFTDSRNRRHRRDVSHITPDRSYLAPVDNNNLNVNNNLNSEYLPPSSALEAEPIPAHELQSDGYHYKTNRHVVYRHI